MLDWAADEGWNPGLDDAAAFRAADQSGFFVTELDGAVVAAISVVNHHPNFAFLGLYLCRPEYRGRGLGYALWTYALDHAGPRTVGLDGVAAQQANYAKSGFVRTGATARFEGALFEAPSVAGLRPFAADTDLVQVSKLDTESNGFARPAFLSAWLTHPTETRKTVVHEAGGEVKGAATARLCRDGCKVGPVIAPDLETALGLVLAAAKAVGSNQLIVDVPDTQPAFQTRLTELGCVSTFETARMYRGTPPKPARPETLFGIATMELG